jgi:hypothetical protein
MAGWHLHDRQQLPTSCFASPNAGPPLSVIRSRVGRIMFAIAGGILLAVLILVLLPWLFVGAAWVVGILIVVGIAVCAVWAFWAGAQSLAGLSVELMLGVVFVVWLFFRMPPRPSGHPNFAVRFLRGWVRVISAPVLAPIEYWRSIQDRRLQGERANVVAVTAGLTWSCFVGVVLSCLSAQGCRQDRSDDRATLDGLKHSRLLSGLVQRPCPLWLFISRRASGQGDPDAPTGVSVHRGFHTYSPVGRVWDADMIAPILRCRGTYSRLLVRLDRVCR